MLAGPQVLGLAVGSSEVAVQVGPSVLFFDDRLFWFTLASTREAVRQLLVEWPSVEGRRRLRAELDEAVAGGRAPETGTLAALALAGEDVTPSLVKLASAHPEAVDELTPEYTAGPLTQQLKGALARETDPGRRRLLGTLAARLCGCGGESTRRPGP